MNIKDASLFTPGVVVSNIPDADTFIPEILNLTIEPHNVLMMP